MSKEKDIYIPKKPFEWFLYTLMNLCGWPFTWIIVGAFISWYAAIGVVVLFYPTFLLWKKLYHSEAMLKIYPRITWLK